MEIFIHSVVSDSPAARIGLQPGDQVVAINGRDDLEDMFDYQFETADSAYLEFTVKRTNSLEEISSIKVFTLEKAPFEDPGLVFTSPVFTPIKTCNNACPFCFIDQQPPGLRPSLYVKDDDWRLSYFNNTYITLTNLTPRDRQRIEQIRPGPLYVSVHSTIPEIRVRLLKNPKFGGHIMKELRWLSGLGVPFHCQVVVCPGINDGESLTQTLEDLHSLSPETMSVAVIPVGLTEVRSHLPDLTPVDETSARSVVQRVQAFKDKYRPISEDDIEDFVFISDEFYYKAGLPLPDYQTYGDFPQLDDGVGAARMLLNDFDERATVLPKRLPKPKRILILTGKLALPSLEPIVERLNKIEGLSIQCLAVESQIWGRSIGVAGLVTGRDIRHTLSNHDLSGQVEESKGYDFAVVPGIMLKEDTHLFLDGDTLETLSADLGLPFKVIYDAYSTQELLTVLGF